MKFQMPDKKAVLQITVLFVLFGISIAETLPDPVDGMMFVQIPAGQLSLQTDPEEYIAIDEFQIMTTEATQDMWAEFTGCAIHSKIIMVLPGRKTYTILMVLIRSE